MFRKLMYFFKPPFGYSRISRLGKMNGSKRYCGKKMKNENKMENDDNRDKRKKQKKEK